MPRSHPVSSGSPLESYRTIHCSFPYSLSRPGGHHLPFKAACRLPPNTPFPSILFISDSSRAGYLSRISFQSMAEFVENLNCLKPSLPFMEMDPSFELMGQFAELNGTAMENSSAGLMGFSGENLLSHLQPEFSTPFVDNLSSFLPLECSKPSTICQPVASNREQSHGDRRRKAKAAPETSSANSSEPPAESSLRDDKSMKKTVCLLCCPRN